MRGRVGSEIAGSKVIRAAYAKLDIQGRYVE
jgi:hypothetical protein